VRRFESHSAALSYTVRLTAAVALEWEAHRALFEAIRRRDPLAATAASEKIVGWAMLAVEQVIRSQEPLTAGQAARGTPVKNSAIRHAGGSRCWNS
jgi:DNA-binding GntR family transcriptional regulator